jgi:hypothetical protein
MHVCVSLCLFAQHVCVSLCRLYILCLHPRYWGSLLRRTNVTAGGAICCLPCLLIGNLVDFPFLFTSPWMSLLERGLRREGGGFRGDLAI